MGTSIPAASAPASIPAATLALSKLATQGDSTVVGVPAGGGTESPIALSQAQLTALINVATGSLKGLLPSTGVPAGLLPASLFRAYCSLGADASGGATHIAATGVKVGDSVVLVANVTDHVSSAGSFESTVTVPDQIQQSAANLSAKTLVILVIAQS